MGPANSEPLLVSLAAELEAINGWANKQPHVWWTPSMAPDPDPTGSQDDSIAEMTPGEVA
jgi:amidase